MSCQHTWQCDNCKVSRQTINLLLHTKSPINYAASHICSTKISFDLRCERVTSSFVIKVQAINSILACKIGYYREGWVCDMYQPTHTSGTQNSGQTNFIAFPEHV